MLPNIIIKMNQRISSIFRRIFSGLEFTSDIVGEQSILQRLSEHWTQSPPNMFEFEEDLINQCGLTNKNMFKLIHILSQDEELKIVTEKYILIFWLQSNIFQLMDIKYNNSFTSKRKLINIAVKNYQFAGSSLQDFVQKCYRAVQTQNPHSIQDIREFITQKKTAEEINQIFQFTSVHISAGQFKDIQENFNDLIADYGKFPNRTLLSIIQKAIIISFTTLYKEEVEHIPSARQFLNSIINHDQISEFIDIQYRTVSPSIKEILRKIRQPQDQNTRLNALKALKANVLPIDVFELQRLIHKTEESKKMIQGKNIIFILGNTGSGKSTNILKFLGYMLTLSQYKGLNTLIPIEKIEKEHQTFLTSPEAKSCTRYINAVKVPEKMYKKTFPVNKRNIVICDSPGFGDSAGVEVDIANCVGMINALHTAQSVRIVVILAYQSIIADRARGLLQIAEIFSNLLHEISNVIDSLVVYFNKVPKDMISQIPKIVESKKNELSSQNKVNEKLKFFLQFIHQQSLKEKRYLFPSQKLDYTDKFEELAKLPSITEVKQNFRYDFTISTKQTINNFISSQSSKIREEFDKGKYQSACLHLRLLVSLRNILIHHQHIKPAVQNLINYIASKSQHQFNFIDSGLKEITQGRNSVNINKSIQQSMNKLKEIYHNFSNLGEINLIKPSQVTQLVQTYKIKVLDKCKQIQSISTNDGFSKSVLYFNQHFDNTLREATFQDLGERYKNQFSQIEALLNEQLSFIDQLQLSFKQGNKLKIQEISKQEIEQIEQRQESMKRSIQRIRMFNKVFLSLKIQSKNKLLNNFVQLQAQLKRKIQQYLLYIRSNFINVVSSSRAVIKSAIKKQLQIEQICSLNFFPKDYDGQSEKQKLQKQLQTQCKQYMKSLSIMQFYSNESNTVINQTAPKNLKNKTQQIQILLIIIQYSKQLEDQFDQIKKSLMQKLNNNINTVKDRLSSLKLSGDDIQKNLNDLKKAIRAIEKTTELLQENNQTTQLYSMIENGLNEIIEELKRQIGKNHLNLNTISGDTLQNIKTYYMNIDSLSKMRELGQEIIPCLENLDKLKKYFLQIIAQPYISILTKDIRTFKQGNEYLFIRNIINRLDKFAMYSSFIIDMFSHEDYKSLQELQVQIQALLLKLFTKIKNQIEAILDAKQEDVSNLSKIIRIITDLKQKNNALIYISKHIDFQPSDYYARIIIHLETIRQQIEKDFYNSKVALTLDNLLKRTRQFSCIRNYPEVDKLNFKQLEHKISSEIIASRKDKNQIAKEAIQGKNPDSIQWSLVKDLYQQPIIKPVIIKLLQATQDKCIGQLNHYNNLFSTQFQSFLSNRQNITEFLDCIYKILTLQLRLNEIYQDKSSIKISKKMIEQKVGSNLIQAFLLQGQSICNQICNYQLDGIEKKILIEKNLEDIIDKIQIKKGNQIIALRVKILQKITFFSGKSQQKTSIKLEGIKIYTCLQRLHGLFNNLVEQRYIKPIAEQLCIDEGFSKYCKYLKLSSSQRIKQNYQQLCQKAVKHFESLQEKYTIQYNSSIVGEAQKVYEEMKNKTIFLPYQIKKTVQNNIKALKTQLQVSDTRKIQQSVESLNSSNNLPNADVFLANYNDLKSKNKMNFVNKIVDQFKKTLLQKSNIIQTMPQNKKFIKEYLQPFFRKIDNGDKLVLSVIQQVFMNSFNRCKKTAVSNLSKIKKYFESSNKNGSNERYKCIQDINQIFSITKTIQQLYNQNQNINKMDFLPNLGENIKELNDIFNQKAQRITVNSQFIKSLSYNKTKQNIREYFYELQQLKAIMDTIRINLVNYPNIANIDLQQQNHLQQRKNEIREQIVHKLSFFDEYSFITDESRNKTSKERQVIFEQINLVYSCLTNVKDLFIDLFDEKSKKIYNKLPQILNEKIKKLNQETENQLQQLFNKGYQKSYSFKIDLFLDILKIMQSKKVSFIPEESINHYKDNLQLKIYQKYDNIKNKTKNSLQLFKQSFDNVKLKRKNNKQQKQALIKSIKDQSRLQLSAAKQLVQNKLKQKLEREADNNIKQNYKNQSSTQLNSLQNDAKNKMELLVKEVQSKNDKALQQAVTVFDQSIKSFCENFILYFSIIEQLVFSKEKQIQFFQNLVENIALASKKKGPSFVKQIQNKLQDNPIDRFKRGNKIMMQYKIFSSFVNNIRREKTSKNGIDYTAENIQKLDISRKENLSKKEKEVILKFYNKFLENYQSYKDRYKANPNQSTIIMVANQCRDLGKQIENDFYKKDRPQRGNKVELLAGIFALWAIMESQEFQGDIEWKVEPHPTQIVTLTFLIGIVHQKQILSNRLAQVGTGEGKSIVLAGLSSFLGLVGFKVRCACYSAYLSKRDQQNFKKLFERLGIENQIKYGTFNELCQDILNSDGVSFKSEVENMFLSQPKGFMQRAANFFGKNILKFNRGPNQIQSNKTILIIDEVDVFFQSSFFGGLYCPAIKLKSPIVSDFLEFVWKQVKAKKQQIQIKDFKQSEPYKKLILQYPTINKLLQNQLHGMISGALAYKHDYFLIDNKIVYRDNDTISPFINYGYKTVFANIYENERGNISKINYDNALIVSLIIAEFSYAQLPKYFHRILGVTGTLQVLPQYKKKVLKDRYSIEDQYLIPSAFGIHNKRKVDYKIVKKQNLTTQIVKRMEQVKDGRPIILFFKKSEDLNNFFCSQQYKPFMNRTFNLTEQHQAKIRDSRISQAVHKDIITLMTSSFGRGTDFMLYDDKINEAGGLHVIQCFLSLQESQEVQIKGRTARQSNKGSYQCILSSSWLEQLDIKEESLTSETSSQQIHKELKNARQKKADTLADATIKLVEQASSKHQQVDKIYNSQTLQQSELIAYIGKINHYPEATKMKIRTVLGIDGTGSMGNGLKKVCEVCSKAFQETYAVLEWQKLKISIEMKIVVYRNYNSPYNQILESTAFENTPNNLKIFLSKVTASGGWSNEAIEVLMQAVNKEEKVDQVIIIADAAPNSDSDVTLKRQHYGESYWNNYGFPSTTFEKQLNQFMNKKKSPIHCFYIKPPYQSIDSIEGQFKQISKKTQGTAQRFIPYRSTASKDLTAFLVENTLGTIQKSNGSKNLIETYRRMFL